MTRTRLGVALAVYAAASVGSSVAVSTRISIFPRLGGLSLRYAMAALLLTAIVLIRRTPWPRITRRDWLLLILLAATGMVGFNMFLLGAVHHADPGAVGAIVGSVPILLVLIGPLPVGRTPAARALLASAVVVAGAALAEGAGSGSRLGLLLALGALGGETVFSLLATPILPRLGPMFVATFGCAIAAVMALLVGLVLDGGDVLRMPTPSEGLSILYLGIAVSGLGFFAWYSAIVRLGVERAGLFTGLMPMFALLTGWALATNDPNPLQFLGVVIVGMGVTIGIRPAKTRPRSIEVEVASSVFEP